MEGKLLCMILVTLLLTLHSTFIYSFSCPAGNLLADSGFEIGSTYCRNNSEALEKDVITFCTIGYGAGVNFSMVYAGVEFEDVLPNNWVNLQTNFAVPGWSLLSGEVNIVSSAYQVMQGEWATLLNGAFEGGSIGQTVTVPASITNPTCTSSWLQATNYLAPTGYSASYQVTLFDVATGLTIWSYTFSAVSYNTSINARSQVPTFTLPTSGEYQLSFTSLDNNPVPFTDGKYPGLSYYARTGAVIDDVCFNCIQSSPTSTPTISLSPSLTPIPSPSPSPTGCGFCNEETYTSINTVYRSVTTVSK